MSVRYTKPLSPLAKFTASIKAVDKAKRNPAESLVAIIDAYTESGQFDTYITEHAADTSSRKRSAQGGGAHRQRGSVCKSKPSMSWIVKSLGGLSAAQLSHHVA